MEWIMAAAVLVVFYILRMRGTKGVNTMTMDLLGLQKEELLDGVQYAGVAAYLADAENGAVNLFI